MKLGLLLKGLSVYKHGLAFSLALHGIALTGTFMCCSDHVKPIVKYPSFSIEMVFLKKIENKSLTQNLLDQSPTPVSFKTTPISPFPSYFTKMKVAKRNVIKKTAADSPLLSKKEMRKNSYRGCEKNNIHGLNSQKYSPASFQGSHFKNPKPHYPRRARELGFEGVVVLHVKVSKVGKATGIDILSSSGYTLLDKTALDTLHQWSFIPAQIGCHLTESNLKIRIRFSLTDANSTDVVAS